jgi:hypothetical protein
MVWARQQQDTGNQFYDGYSNQQTGGVETVWGWSPTVEAALGMGVTTPALTYLRLTRGDGTFVYIYVSSGTTVTCSTSQP